MPEMKSPPLVADLLSILRGIFNDVGLGSKDLETLSKRAKCEGISFFTKTLPTLGKAFDRALSGSRFDLPCHFKKKWRDKEIPAFCGSLFCEVFDHQGYLLPNADPVAVKSIRQICFLAYKLVQPFKDEEVNRTFDNFVQIDESLTNQEFDDLDLVEKMSELTETVFRGYLWSDCNPKHGPGVTSDTSIEFKNETVPHPSSRVFRHFGSECWEFSSEKSLDNQIHHLINLALNLVGYTYENHACPLYEEPHAKVIAVPKDSRGPRIISAEPCANQYVQQGIMQWTVSRLEDHPITRGRLNFTDQTVNQLIALNGSRDLSWSTLDLKDASDRVTLALVQKVFGRVPQYLEDILACRTTHTDLTYPNGTVKTVELQKFAPMGSALCFTTLAWVAFSAAVCHLSRSIPLHEALRAVTVYGDDVCVKTQYAHEVVKALTAVGLLVNVDKSFIQSRFLESCGVDAFDGYDVTPVRLKQFGTKSTLPPRSPVLVSMVASANNLIHKGYPHSSEIIFRLVENMIGKLPYGTKDSSYLCRHATGFQPYYNEEKFRLTETGRIGGIHAWCVKSNQTDFNETGYGRLRRTIRQLGQELILPDYGSIVLPRKTTLVRKFVKTSG